MCASGLVKLVFSVTLLLGTGLLIAALLTPWWRNVDAKDAENNVIKGKDFSLGLLPIFCGQNAEKGTDVGTACTKYWENMKTSEKIALGTLVLAILTCFCAFIWNCIMCFACCCDKCLIPPLPIFTGLAAILASVSVVVYCVNAKENPIDKLPDGTVFTKGTDFGVSMWFAVAGIACLIIDTILGICLVRMKKSPLGSVI